MTKNIGFDWSVYQGNYGKYGYGGETFAIAQIGGIGDNGLYDQSTYNDQVSNGLASGLKMHTYIWYQVGGNTDTAKTVLDYFLPKVKTPKGSIVALDYEAGASSDVQSNTNAVLYGMDRIAKAGYTPMYYSYKPYTMSLVYYKQIIAKYPNSLWIAAYPNYSVTRYPDYNYFPSMDGVAIWQFTSTYVSGGLDANVDLLGITENGYTNKPVAISPDYNVVTALGGYNTTYGDGYQHQNTYSKMQYNTQWKSFGILPINRLPYYYVGTNEWYPQYGTTLSGICQINYAPGYGVMAVDGAGHQIAGSNSKFKTGTRWKASNYLVKIKDHWYYQVATDIYIDTRYSIGSGYTYN